MVFILKELTELVMHIIKLEYTVLSTKIGGCQSPGILVDFSQIASVLIQILCGL